MHQLAITMASFQDLEIAKTCFESASPWIFALIQSTKQGFLLRFFKTLNCYEKDQKGKDWRNVSEEFDDDDDKERLVLSQQNQEKNC